MKTTVLPVILLSLYSLFFLVCKHFFIPFFFLFILQQDLGLGKRLLACVLSALKAEDCTGVHCEITPTNNNALDFYSKLGFYNIQLKEQPPPDTMIFARTLWKITFL